MGDEVDDVLVLWGKPFEDLVTTFAQFIKKPRGWSLRAISPVKFARSESDQRSVFIDVLRAHAGSELVWEATDPSTLYTVTAGLPAFSSGEEIRIQAAVFNKPGSGGEPAQFAFLHRPGPGITAGSPRSKVQGPGGNGIAD